MYLNSLELFNIGPHEHLKWDFGPGLIGVLGPNGAGKSSAVNIAAYAAMTNDYSRHLGGKEGLIRQQAAPDDKSGIVLDFKQNGVNYEITRGLRGMPGHRMRKDGKRYLEKDGDIRAELEEVLGISQRLVKEYIFVNQWQLFAMFSAQPADRMKSFAHLCNTVLTEQLWDMLKETIDADTSIAESIDDNSDQLLQDIGLLTARLSTIEASLSKQRSKLLPSATKEQELDTLVKRYDANQRIREKIPALEAQEQTAKKLTVAAIKARKSAQEAVDEKDAKTAELQQQMQTAKTLLDVQKERQKQLKLLQNAESEISMYSAKLLRLDVPKLPKGLKAIDATVAAIATARAELAIHEKALKTFDKAGVCVCPTCGTSSDTVDLSNAKARVPVLKAEIGDLEKRKAARQAYDSDFQEFERKHARYQSGLDNARRNKENIGEVDVATPEQITNWQNHLDAWTEHETRLAGFRSQLADAATHAERSKASHQSLKTRLTEYQEELEANKISEYDFNQATMQLATHRAAQSEVRVLKATEKEVTDNKKKFEEQLERLRVRLKRANNARRWLRDITDVRDEVFHRDKLPKHVHHSYLVDMEDDINEELARFNSSFYVKATEDVSLIAHFANGTKMPVQPGGVSGGQLVMAAIANRLTVNSIFAPQLGIMVLDEPTDGLDAENRKLAAEIFKRLGELAKSRGHQVIVITHDEMLESCFDQKFILGKPV